MNRKKICKMGAFLATGMLFLAVSGGQKILAAEGTSTLSDEILTEGVYEESELGLIYSGSWPKHYDSYHSGTTAKYSYTPGDYVTFSFVGTGFDIRSYLTPNRGYAKFTIDGVEGEPENMAVDDYEFRKIISSQRNLEYGLHTVKFEVTDIKDESSNALTQLLDYVQIYDDSETILQAGSYEESDKGIHYDGRWVRQFSDSFSGGKGRYSCLAGSSVSFKFEGTGFDIKSFLSPNRGIANVSIDGQTETVDLASTEYGYNKSIYKKTGLESGVHTVKLEVTGDKNDTSNAITQFIDSVDIFN